jgi:hypothetical protein
VGDRDVDRAVCLSTLRPSTIANVSGTARETDQASAHQALNSLRHAIWSKRLKSRRTICDSKKAESDPMPAALARVQRLDCRGEGLLVRVKLACGSTKANGRV